ncbi:MAG: DUF2279 domain-containing protein [Bacteroidia bacterium]
MNLKAQDSLNYKKPLNNKQKLVIAGIAAQQAGSFYIEYNWWWKNNYHPFNLKNDGGFNNYSLGIDKVGHFYVSYLYYHAIHEIMTYGEFSKRTINTTSVLLPALWALSIEIGDGFSRYAFNPDDLVANFLGITYGLAQHNIKWLEPFNFKMSYIPSKKFIDNKFKGWALSDDYDGHIYWLTANLHQINSSTFNAALFKYFNIGVGYGIDNFNADKIGREFFVGLDYNLSAVNTKNKKVLTAFKNIADKWHFPAPGIKTNLIDNTKFKTLILN